MKNVAMLFAVALIAAIVFEKASYQEAKGELFWENVEALATGELDYPEGWCFGSGDFTCPATGVKVAYALGRQDLEYDE